MKVYPFLSTSDLNLYISNLLFPDSWLYYYLFIIVIIITSLLFLIAWQWKPTIQGLNIRLCSRETRIFLMLQFLANQQSTCVVDLCTNNDVSYTSYRSTTRSPLVFKVVPKGVFSGFCCKASDHDGLGSFLVFFSHLFGDFEIISIQSMLVFFSNTFGHNKSLLIQ